MSSITAPTTASYLAPVRTSARGHWPSALAALARRRLSLSARTPREVIVPLLNPILFAIVIAPALAKLVGNRAGFDYMTFAAVGAVGLLVPINALFAGIGVIVDRDSGSQRDLLAAPVPRSFLVLSNLGVALLTTALQVTALIVAVSLRGASFQVSSGGILWFAGAVGLLAIGMYGVAETLASRMQKQEEYVGVLPAVAILPYFFAGSLFPISTLPTALAGFAKILPLTHAMAMMRYALVDGRAGGLHDIWGAGDPTRLAAQSLAILAGFAVLMTVVSMRMFSRKAVQ
ncbi:MAG: ABC transporter permease [Candidatus Dormiibacterota bacterium]